MYDLRHFHPETSTVHYQEELELKYCSERRSSLYCLTRSRTVLQNRSLLGGETLHEEENQTTLCLKNRVSYISSRLTNVFVKELPNFHPQIYYLPQNLRKRYTLRDLLVITFVKVFIMVINPYNQILFNRSL